MPDHDLHVCRVCGSNLVQPLAWQRFARRDVVELSLRCPECESIFTGAFGPAAICDYEDELDRGMDELVDTLTRVQFGAPIEGIQQ